MQQSPWLGIANRQMELMGRYMAEIGLTPAARSRITSISSTGINDPITIRRMIVDPPYRSLAPGDAPRLLDDGTLVVGAEDAEL